MYRLTQPSRACPGTSLRFRLGKVLWVVSPLAPANPLAKVFRKLPPPLSVVFLVMPSYLSHMLAMVGDNKRIPPSRSGAFAPTLLRALNGWSDACESGRVWSVVGCVVVVGISLDRWWVVEGRELSLGVAIGRGCSWGVLMGHGVGGREVSWGFVVGHVWSCLNPSRGVVRGRVWSCVVVGVV